MDDKTCARCPWARLEKAHGGWYYWACYHEPYNGAWVKQIDCPKGHKENNMKKSTITATFLDKAHGVDFSRDFSSYSEFNDFLILNKHKTPLLRVTYND